MIKRLLIASVVALTAMACLPSLALAAKTSTDSGALPAGTNMLKPTNLSGAIDTPPLLGMGVQASGPSGGGTNTIYFGNFDTGDFCCVFGSGFGHAGIFDGDRYHGSSTDYCMLSANVAPRNGVQWEPASKYRRYDKAYGLWVPSLAPIARSRAFDWAEANLGEPYALNAPKADNSEWYCSKLVWAAYKYRCYKDLDANGGYWVSPADLVNDRETAVFAKSD